MKQDGEFHVRGGRSGELGYMIEGLGATNRFTNEDGVPVIPEAIEQLDVSTGGYSAEFGGWNSGLVFTQLRTGGDRWTVSGNVQTDDLARPGNKFAGTSSFGYRDAVLTAGGPFPGLNNLRIFIAGENNYARNRQVMFLSPFEMNLTTDMYDPHPGEALPSPIFFKENSIPNNLSEATTIQGTASYNLKPLNFRLVGSFETRRQPDGSAWPDALVRFFNQGRTPVVKVNSEFLSVRATHSLSGSTSYVLAVSYYGRSSNTLDPDFGDDWRSYSDSLTNAAHGYSGFLNRWYGAPQYSIINGFYLDNQNTPNITYSKDRQQCWTIAGGFSSEVNEHWTVKVGGDVEAWTMRLFNVGYIPGLMSYQYGLHGGNQQTFPDPMTRRAFLTRAGLINNYGYDVDGNPVNNGLDAPRTPLFISAYIQTDVELEDFTLGLGLRYERYDLKDSKFTGITSYNNLLDAIDDTKLAEGEPSSLVLPRVALSYKADEKTILGVQYGAYAQMPALNQIFNGNIFMSRTVIGDRLYATPAGYYAKPERTNLLQITFARKLSPTVTVSAGYYIGLGIVAAIVLGILAWLAAMADANLALLVSGVGTVVVVLGMILIAVRLVFLMPAVVVAENHVSLKRGYHLTYGNFWRIVGVVLAIVIPIALVQSVIQMMVFGSDFMAASIMPSDSPEEMAAKLQVLQTQLSHGLIYMVPVWLIVSIVNLGLSSGAGAFAYRALTGSQGSATPKS